MGQKLEKILDCEEKEVGYDDSDDENEDPKGPKGVKKQEKSLENESNSMAQSIKENTSVDKVKASKNEDNTIVKPKIANFMGEEDKLINQDRNLEQGRPIKPFNES